MPGLDPVRPEQPEELMKPGKRESFRAYARNNQRILEILESRSRRMAARIALTAERSAIFFGRMA
jgi:hypothetical protein